jgi:hypothetical protein
MHAFLDAAAIRWGGVERVVEAVNGRIREIEVVQGISPARSRSTVHPTTWRSWTRGSRPRYAVVIQAVCDVTGYTSEELGWVRGTVDDVNRRGFLSGAASAVLTGAVVPLLPELGAPPEPDPEAYAARAAQLWTACWTAEPIGTVYAAADHADQGRVLLGRSRGRDHRQIADAVAMAAILTGRVAFFDLGRPDVAQRVWTVAPDYLGESDDHALKACLHGHQAFIPGWAGRWAEAEK